MGSLNHLLKTLYIIAVLITSLVLRRQIIEYEFTNIVKHSHDSGLKKKKN